MKKTLFLFAAGILLSTNSFAQTVFAIFTSDVNSGCSPLVVTFTNNSIGATSYIWDFGDGSATSTVTNPVHTYTASGTFVVQLTANGFTGTNSTFSSITVDPFPNVFITSLQSPFTACNSGSTNLQDSSSISSGSISSWSWAPSSGLSCTSCQNTVATPSVTTVYTLSATSNSGCVSANIFTVFIPTTPSPMPLCLCTVDTTSTKNIVNWEKPTPQGNIDSFKIYRDFGPTPIVTLPYSHISSFTDTTFGINPNVACYKYQITYKTSTGTECTRSNPQKTMFLQVTRPTPPAFQLDWTEYFGADYVGYYRIMRDGNNSGNFIKIDSVPCNTLTYTDPNPPTDSAVYYIETITAQACNVSLRTGGNNSVQGTVVKSRSNVKNNRSTGINKLELKQEHFSVYPNPNDGRFNLNFDRIDYSTSYSLEIYNAVGEKVYYEKVRHRTTAIDIPSLPNGMFEIRLIRQDGKSIQTKFIKF